MSMKKVMKKRKPQNLDFSDLGESLKKVTRKVGILAENVEVKTNLIDFLSNISHFDLDIETKDSLTNITEVTMEENLKL